MGWRAQHRWNLEKWGNSGTIKLLTLIVAMGAAGFQIAFNKRQTEINNRATLIEEFSLQPHLSAELKLKKSEVSGDKYLMVYEYSVKNYGNSPAYEFRSGTISRPRRDVHLPDPFGTNPFGATEVSGAIFPGVEKTLSTRREEFGFLDDSTRTEDTGYVAIFLTFKDALRRRHFCVFDYFVIFTRRWSDEARLELAWKTGVERANCLPLSFRHGSAMPPWNAVVDSLFP